MATTPSRASAVPYYVEAIAEACRVGCSFVEGVARVSLASARARIGDVPGAAEGFGYLIALLAAYRPDHPAVDHGPQRGASCSRRRVAPAPRRCC